MRRREFLGVLGSAAAAWPLPARAQQSDRVRRTGALLGLEQSDALAQSYIAVFRQHLRELGWEEGRNLSIDIRWAGDDTDRARSHARELVRLNPEVIFAQSGMVLPLLQRATGTIPIVFVQIADPLAGGFVASLARPGGNVTGFALAEFATGGKSLEVL